MKNKYIYVIDTLDYALNSAKFVNDSTFEYLKKLNVKLQEIGAYNKYDINNDVLDLMISITENLKKSQEVITEAHHFILQI